MQASTLFALQQCISCNWRAGYLLYVSSETVIDHVYASMSMCFFIFGWMLQFLLLSASAVLCETQLQKEKPIPLPASLVSRWREQCKTVKHGLLIHLVYLWVALPVTASYTHPYGIEQDHLGPVGIQCHQHDWMLIIKI